MTATARPDDTTSRDEADRSLPPTTTFFSVTGGQGCTTAALLYAWYLSRLGHRTLLVSDTPVIGSLLAISTTDDVAIRPVTDTLSVTWAPQLAHYTGFDRVVVDRGRVWDESDVPADGILCLRPRYADFARALALNAGRRRVVVLRSPGEALTDDDVRVALAATSLFSHVEDPALQRVFDAGIFVFRQPTGPSSTLAPFIDQENQR